MLEINKTEFLFSNFSRLFFSSIGLNPVTGRPGEHLPPLNFSKIKSELEEKHNQQITETDVLSSAMYPKVTGELDLMVLFFS